jgi:hypothetical protein
MSFTPDDYSSPRLRTVNKVLPFYPLNAFPANFISELGGQITYLLATRKVPDLEGKEWEQIFAKCIGAEWRPSNVGLDDIVMDSCAWGAKTVKSSNPFKQKKVRLISGRNSPIYSFGESNISSCPPNPLGKQVLGIWNERVASVRSKFKHLRTIVLMKSNTLLDLAIFEFDTIRYDPELYEWHWNKNGNLEGDRDSTHIFTWQPHGSQFTIIEDVPDNRLCIKLKNPPSVSQESVLRDIGFNNTWIEIVR